MKCWAALILAGILIAGSALRCWHIGQASYWYDEFCSLETSAGHDQEQFDIRQQVILTHPPDLLSLGAARPAWKIWFNMGEEFHPPLYSILLRLWRDLFGSTEAATRSLSALAGILGIACIFDVGRLAHGRDAGLWTAAIFAVAGPQVVYAQETRGYTMVVFFGLCALDAIVRVEKFGVNRRRLLALFASSLGMMLTHYVGVPVAVALGIYLLIFTRGKTRLLAAGALLAAGFVYAGIWGPFVIPQRHTAASVESDFLREGAWSPFYALAHLASLPIELLGPLLEKDIASAWPSAIIYLLPILLFRQNRFLMLWLFWLIGSGGLFALLDQFHSTHHLSYTRYILMCGPAFYLIFAGVLSGNRVRRWWLAHLVPALAVIFCLVSLPASFAERRWPDWRAIAAKVDGMKRPDDLVAFAWDGKKNWFSGLYMEYAFYAATPPQPILLLTSPPDRFLSQELHAYQGIVLISGTNENPERLFVGHRIVRSNPFLPFLTTFRMERR